jgi:hypothetical protein
VRPAARLPGTGASAVRGPGGPVVACREHSAIVGILEEGRMSSSSGAPSQFTRGSLVVAFLLWLFVAVFLAASLQFTPRARVLPQVIGVPLLLVATISLIREIRVVLLGRTVRGGGRPAGEDPVEARSPREEMVPFLWLGALVTLVLVLGLLFGSILFLVLFLRLYGKERWPVVVAMPLVLYLIIDVAFVEFFGFKVFPGYLLPALGIPADILGIG